MNLLYGHDKLVADFVAGQIFTHDRGFGACRGVGVIDEHGSLVAGYVYHNWEPETGVIEMSSAALTPRWLTRPILREMFGYPFRIGCQMIIMRVSEQNTRLHRQFKALGLRPHTIPRLYGRDQAGIVFTLTDDDWFAGRFVREYGQAESTNPP